MRVTKIALLCWAIMGASSGSGAQAGLGNAQSPSVSLPFVVTDAQGVPVDNITTEGISIRDDKHPAKAVIAVIPAKDLPLRLGLVVQDSGSMRGVRGFYPIISSADDFLKAAMVTDSDACFIGTFNRSPHFSEWMARGQNPHFTIQFLQSGSSALFDSLLAAVSTMDSKPPWPARRVVVIIGDGHDNASSATSDKLRVALESSSTTVIWLETPEAGKKLPPDYRRTQKSLSDLVKKTGGLLKVDLTPEDASKVFADTEDWIAAVHVVTYSPSEYGKSGKRHSVEMRIASSENWRVAAPLGYFEK